MWRLEKQQWYKLPITGLTPMEDLGAVFTQFHLGDHSVLWEFCVKPPYVFPLVLLSPGTAQKHTAEFSITVDQGFRQSSWSGQKCDILLQKFCTMIVVGTICIPVCNSLTRLFHTIWFHKTNVKTIVFLVNYCQDSQNIIKKLKLLSCSCWLLKYTQCFKNDSSYCA